ncbi:MAG: DUF2071 domain-containing protein [Gemmatales bacterium]|nr:DUF2071 domain-containing protein [Gemmatales bacterium]MDW7993697.1 DUF2071 domain-containing protein [Gemmatales bacterium]
MWKQCLRHVLFLHWPLEAAIIRKHIPRPLAVDQYENQAWLSLVVVRLEIALASIPWPRLRFPQVNLRTYVRYRDRPGIWFFSLHPHHQFASNVARWMTPLPFRHAHVHYQLGRHGGRIHAVCRHRCYLELDIMFTITSSTATCATLETWLLERYHVFAVNRRGTLLVGNFQHEPWQTFQAQVDNCRFSAAPLLGLNFPAPPVANFSLGVDGQFGSFQPLIGA